MTKLSDFVKNRRKQLGLTQDEFAEKAGVALTVIRKIEQGKENLRDDRKKAYKELIAQRCRQFTVTFPENSNIRQ